MFLDFFFVVKKIKVLLIEMHYIFEGLILLTTLIPCIENLIDYPDVIITNTRSNSTHIPKLLIVVEYFSST